MRASELDRIRASAPDAHQQLARAYELTWKAADPEILELVRLRVAMLLGCETELITRTEGVDLDEEKIAKLDSWVGSTLFSPVERACLTLTEQFVVYAPGVTNQMTDAVLEYFRPKDLYGLVNALYVFDTRQRLTMALERVFAA